MNTPAFLRPPTPEDDELPVRERTFQPCSLVGRRFHGRCLGEYVSPAGVVHRCDCECHQ